MDTLASSNKMNYEFLKSNVSIESFDSGLTISRTPKSRVKLMYFAATSCLFLGLTVGLCSGYAAPATYDLNNNPTSRVKPTELEISWIGSIIALGMMPGNLLAGPLLDKFGRKDVMVFNIIPAALGWLMICYAPSALVIILGRVITGVSIGVLFVGVPTYCVEISTPKIRGILGSGFQGFLVIGHLLSVTIGSYITWDQLALNAAIFSIVGVIGFSFMPESPRWLIAKGRLKEAILNIKKLQGDDVDAEKEVNIINDDLKNKPELSLKELKNPTIYKPTIISTVIYFFSQFSGMMVIFSFSSDIFKISKDFIEPTLATIVLAIVQVIATLTSNFIVDKAGRKILMIISGSLMAVTMAVLGVYFYMSSKTDFSSYSWLPLVSLMLFVAAYSIGYGPVSVLLTAEMMPTRVRSTMTGVVGLTNGVYAFIVVQTYIPLKKVINIYGAFWLYSCFCVIGVIFLVIVVPETKGRKLEELENMFSKQKRNEQNSDLYVVP